MRRKALHASGVHSPARSLSLIPWSQQEYAQGPAPLAESAQLNRAVSRVIPLEGRHATTSLCVRVNDPTQPFALAQSNPAPLINQQNAPGAASQPEPNAKARILDSYDKLPLSFEANHGQTDAMVKFLLRTRGYSLFLTGDEAVLASRGSNTNTNKLKVVTTAPMPRSGEAASVAGSVLRMKLRNANAAAKFNAIHSVNFDLARSLVWMYLSVCSTDIRMKETAMAAGERDSHASDFPPIVEVF